MAKTKARDLFVTQVTSGGTVQITGKTRKPGKAKVSSSVEIYRTGDVGDRAFEACVVIGKMLRKGRFVGPSWNSNGKKLASGYTTSCMHGRNPRKALQSALSRAARQMGQRSGAFARHGK